MKWPSEILQNLQYFYHKKTHVVFFHFLQINFFLVNALVYVDIGQGIHRGKNKVAQKEERKKLCGFSYDKNIANFEGFH